MNSALFAKIIPSDSDIDRLIKSHRSKDANAWAAILDETLPQRLRDTHTTFPSDYIVEEDLQLQRLEAIVKIISRARDIAKVDLVTYLGVHKDRWDVVNWVVGVMLKKCQDYRRDDEPNLQLYKSIWPTRGQTLDDMTEYPTALDLPEPAGLSLDDLYDWETDTERARNVSIKRQCLAQIWQILGCLILHAEDETREPEKSGTIMSHVLTVLAQVHHVNALPASIYNYSPAKDSSVTQRPPTLYLLSARIMAVLSDVAWKKHWMSEMQQAKDYGYELPEPRIQPQLHHVGAEIWLELVLWTCVEGGWILEAAWIVSEIEKRRKQAGIGWVVVSWDELYLKNAPTPEWTGLLKLQIDKSRLNQATGIGIANSGTSSIEVGSHTISHEVVSAILDGIINRASTKPKLFGKQIGVIHQHVVECNNLLTSGQPNVSASMTNAALVRIIESAALDAQASNSYTANIIRQSAGLECTVDHNRLAFLNEDEYVIDTSASVLGLLYRNLYEHSFRGYHRGILRSLGNILDLIDANRHIYIQDFANDLRQRLKQGQDEISSIRNHENKASPMLYPYIPVHVMSYLLNSVAANGFDGLGRWIIHNNDIDGGILPSQMYGSATLQPALLDFATATKDDVLLHRVLEKLQPPLSVPILHALLRYQIASDKWQMVQDMLNHFKTSTTTEWYSGDALAIAAAVLRHGKPGFGKAGVARQAQTTLFDLLRGRFDRPQNPALRPNSFKIQEANQLKRLLRSLPGGIFDFLVFDEAREAGRLSSHIRISSLGFSIILEDLVKRFGATAGQQMWQQWCLTPDHGKSRYINDDNIYWSTEASTEKVVLPTISMLRTVVRPIIQKYRGQSLSNKFVHPEGTQPAGDEHDSYNSRLAKPRLKDLSSADLSVLKWAIPLYRNFGFNDGAIRGEFPGIHI